ncbi:MAG: hypothetical protein CL583_17175 [Alteromonadaceae bacterium]|nr:hypothetical protein [Alteromonadaceae bacterium]|tara:strand:- start:4498 stop:4905 length:408 start_codon:yes stop_codon:yes gene_type:complete
MSIYFLLGRAIGTAAIACSLSLGAAAEQAPAQHEATVRMGPTKGFFSEKCLTFPGATRVEYRFTSPHPVDFNVHLHRDDQTLYPVKLQAVKALKAMLDVEPAQEYCFMWTSNSAVAAEWELKFGYTDQGKRSPRE